MKGKVLFVSGIDTSVGKTVATGLLAKALMVAGKRVITQKMIQTGCVEVSEDIEAHRQIQGIDFTEEDKAGLTCPYIFTYPCSPHMAAAKDGREIDLSVIWLLLNNVICAAKLLHFPQYKKLFLFYHSHGSFI